MERTLWLLFPYLLNRSSYTDSITLPSYFSEPPHRHAGIPHHTNIWEEFYEEKDKTTRNTRNGKEYIKKTICPEEANTPIFFIQRDRDDIFFRDQFQNFRAIFCRYCLGVKFLPPSPFFFHFCAHVCIRIKDAYYWPISLHAREHFS